jgi:hypothetical protein
MSWRLGISLAIAMLGVLAGAWLALNSDSVDAVTGSVSGTVFHDRNNDGFYEGPSNSTQFISDGGVAGIIVRAFDADGALVGTTTSAADGTYTLEVTGAATVDLRIEFEIPSSVPALEGFTSAISNFYANFAGQSYGPVRFVKVGASKVDYGIHRPAQFCLNNPGLMTCLQPMGDADGKTAPGAVVFRAGNMWATNKTANYAYTSNTVFALADRLGSVFGIGVDPAVHRRRSPSRPGNAFMGTYVKRHSEYGDAGATNTIYHVTVPQVGAGTVTTFITLPGTLPEHDATPAPGFANDYTADTEIFPHVGRIGLGDVDVMDDAQTILAVDMDEKAPKLYFIPIIESATGTLSAGTPSAIEIPRPNTFNEVACEGIWHPMGIGTRGDRILVGGVCGAEDSVTPSLPNGPHQTRSAAFVMEYSGELDGTGSFTTIYALNMGYPRGCLILEAGCDHNTSKVGDPFSADWGAWNEYPRYVGAIEGSNPQAMLANIEIADNGDLILGFRDRFGDQVKTGSAAWSEAYRTDAPHNEYPKPSAVYPTAVYNIAGGDMRRVCNSGGTLVSESNGTCSGLAGSRTFDWGGTPEFYMDNYPHFQGDPNFSQHPETINGSTATIPGYDGVWVTAWDISSVNQQGVLSFGPCENMVDGGSGGVCYPADPSSYGSRIGGIALRVGVGTVTWPDDSGFSKGSGLADLEVICDEAPVAIGNSLWHDLDDDGIRDPGEPVIVGATVNLYNSAGVLVGTAITNSEGMYVFMSHFSGEAYIGGGLVPGEEFTIRLDNPNDYLEGGPLHGYYPAWANTTTDSPFATSAGIDSDAYPSGTGTTIGVDSFPTIYVEPLEPGDNISTYDFGVNQEERVGVGDFVWVDTNRDGVQGENEPGLAGVVVTLLHPDTGEPVLRPDGSTASAVTDADGFYFIDNLLPGTYQALFVVPDGYVFTVTGQGSSGEDSNPNPLTGVTAEFTLTLSDAGDMTVDGDPATRASGAWCE